MLLLLLSLKCLCVCKWNEDTETKNAKVIVKKYFNDSDEVNGSSTILENIL